MRIATLIICCFLMAATALAGTDEPFRIRVVDRKTGRGVPMVELTTTHHVTYITDSAGVVAFDEPGLMNQRVFFTVRSHGYEFPKDGFGMAGRALDVHPGGSATLQIDRVNIAERLYRVTGAGVYHHSVRLGDTPPIEQPVNNAGVLGQDSVQNVIYRGRLWWMWGDTTVAKYPLGIFHMTAATTPLSNGGVDPATGINLNYFKGEDGIARAMAPMPGKPGPVWLDALMVVRDQDGREAMFARYLRVKTLGELHEQGFMRFDDDTGIFQTVQQVPLDAPLMPEGHPLEVIDEAGRNWFYFCRPLPLIRCRADIETITDAAKYETYTCLKPGSAFDADKPALDRDDDGKLVWGWKRNTAYLSHSQQQELVTRGHIRPDEALIKLTEPGSDKPLILASGSTFWNDYRKRYITLAQQLFGTSAGGEVWYLESESLTGPWVNPRKVVTHDNYTFYNVKHHPYFDQQGGRVILFEGTYTTFMTNRASGTPRYDYNQIMYRLDLADLGL